MLSPLDAQLVLSWAELGVPFEVVARGIRRAAERALWDAPAQGPSLRSLRACKRQVDAEIKKYAARAVGEGTQGEAGEDLVLERHKRMCAAIRKAAREHSALMGPSERLLETLLSDPPEGLVGANRREEAALLLLLRGLPFELRLGLLREARQRRGDQAGMSARARKLSARFHTLAVMRKAFSLPSFW